MRVRSSRCFFCVWCLRSSAFICVQGTSRELCEEGTVVDWESNGVPAPFDTMSIRTFCKYYRIADTIFWSGSDSKRAKKRADAKDDVEYYSSYALHQKLDDCDLEPSPTTKRVRFLHIHRFRGQT